MQEPSTSPKTELTKRLRQLVESAKERAETVTLAAALEQLPALRDLDLPDLALLLADIDGLQSGASWQLVRLLARDHESETHEVRLADGQRRLLRWFRGRSDIDARALQRVAAEVAVLQKAGHPALATILEVGQSEGFFYTLETWPGDRTLAELLSAIASTEEDDEAARLRKEALLLLADAAEELARAHDLGILHGGLRPESIRRSEQGVEIRGLGLSSLRTEQAPVEARDGLIYRAPEQLTWKHARQDRRSDVWALTALVHQVILSEPPIALMSEAQLRREAARFAPRPVHPERFGLPRSLELVLNQGLAPEPSRRYGDVADLARDLKATLRGERPQARAASLSDRYLRWMRREPGIATAGFVIFALLGTAGIVFGWFVGVGDRDAAVIPLEKELAQNRSRDAALAASARETLRDQELARAVEGLGLMMEVVRFGPLHDVLLPDLLQSFLDLYDDRGIKLDGKPDLEATSALLDEAFVRSPALSARLRSGLYRMIALIDDLKGSSDHALREEFRERCGNVERNITIFVERCEKDPALRHLWRVARHGDAHAYDRFDAFLDQNHWRNQSDTYIGFLADHLANYPERLDAARLLVAESLRFRADSALLQLRGGLIELTQARRRSPLDVDGLKSAIVHLEVATALCPQQVAPRLPLAEALALDGNLRDAIQSIEAATKLGPDSAITWLLRALFFQSHPLGKRAQEAAEQALHLNPDWRQRSEITSRIDLLR